MSVQLIKRQWLRGVFLLLVVGACGQIEASEHSVGAMHHAGGGIENVSELIGQIVTFIVFVGILIRFLGPKLNAFFIQRHESIKRALGEAQLAQQQAQAKFEEYQRKIKNIDAELESLRAQFSESLHKERDRLIKEATLTAERIKSEAQQAVSHEFERARQSLREEAARAALDMAEQVVRRELQPADNERLVREFVQDMTRLNTQQAKVI